MVSPTTIVPTGGVACSLIWVPCPIADNATQPTTHHSTGKKTLKHATLPCPTITGLCPSAYPAYVTQRNSVTEAEHDSRLATLQDFHYDRCKRRIQATKGCNVLARGGAGSQVRRDAFYGTALSFMSHVPCISTPLQRFLTAQNARAFTASYNA